MPLFEDFNAILGDTSTIKKEMNKKRAEYEACSMLIDAMIDAELSSDAPEKLKINLRIMQATNKVQRNIRDFVTHFADPTTLYDAPEAFKARQEALEYITLVNVGLERYMQQIKQPNGQTENY